MIVENVKNNNGFSIKYYKSFLELGKKKGYEFVTISQFLKKGCPKKGHIILRHDLDTKPQTLQKMLDIEEALGVRSTNFIRVLGNEYNFLSYPVFNMIKSAKTRGHEIGLHTSCVEWATINNLDPMLVLELEVSTLRKFIDFEGIAPHRDLNYSYNSLPFIEDNWLKISSLGVSYQGYQDNLIDSTIYVNEGFNPHLCWRNQTPEQAMAKGESVYILTHNHWWYENHPFEEWS